MGEEAQVGEKDSEGKKQREEKNCTFFYPEGIFLSSGIPLCKQVHGSQHFCFTEGLSLFLGIFLGRDNS